MVINRNIGRREGRQAMAYTSKLLCTETSSKVQGAIQMRNTAKVMILFLDLPQMIAALASTSVQTPT